MKHLWLILGCLCLLIVPIAHGSNYGYPQYHSYSYPQYYPVYVQPQVQVYNNYLPYAVPLYSTGAYQPTAVISGAVAYQQSITATTTATAGAQSTVQTVQGAAYGLAQQAAAQQAQGTVQQAVKEELHVQHLRTHCADCHSGQGARKQFQIFDAAGKYVLDPANVGKVLFRLSTSRTDPQTGKSLRMPPNGRLPEDVKDTITDGVLSQSPVKEDGPINPKKEEGF